MTQLGLKYPNFVSTQKGWFSFISKEFWAIGIYFDSKSAQHQCHVSTS